MSPDTAPPRGFDEAWQAQVHAISQVLLESDHISAVAWSETLGAAIRRRLADGDPDTTDTYYRAMTDAVESILQLNGDDVLEVVEAWRAAYLSTPHGKPVALRPAHDTSSARAD